MNSIKKVILLFVILVIIIFSGCDAFINFLTTTEKPEEELVFQTSRDSEIYTYSEKVQVSLLPSGEGNDTLKIRTGVEDAYWNIILSGQFERVAWHDYKIFIIMEDMCYVFDIYEYEIPIEKYAEPIYELKEYCESEISVFFPEYKSFDWYVGGIKD